MVKPSWLVLGKKAQTGEIASIIWKGCLIFALWGFFLLHTAPTKARVSPRGW